MRKILISACLLGCVTIYADIGKVHAPGRFFTLDDWHSSTRIDHQDALYLNDGSEIKGSIKFLPPLHFGFGKVEFSVDDIALVAFLKVGNQLRAQYITKAGENYIGSVKADPVKIKILVGSNGYGVESAINPRDIDHIILTTHDSLAAKPALFSIQLKNGDQFPFSPIKQTISLSEKDKSIELPVDNIEEIIVEGYVKGTYKDRQGKQELDRATIKDKLFGIYIPASKENIKLPWENIKIIQAGRNGFIFIKEKYSSPKITKTSQPLEYAPEAFDAFIAPAFEPKPPHANLEPIIGDDNPGATVSYGLSSAQPLITPEGTKVSIENIPSVDKQARKPQKKDDSVDTSIAFAAEAFIAFQRPLDIPPNNTSAHYDALFGDGTQVVSSSRHLASLTAMTSLDVVERKKEKVQHREEPKVERILSEIESFDSPIQFTYDIDTKFDRPLFESIDSSPSFNDIAWLPIGSQNNEPYTDKDKNALGDDSDDIAARDHIKLSTTLKNKPLPEKKPGIPNTITVAQAKDPGASEPVSLENLNVVSESALSFNLNPSGLIAILEPKTFDTNGEDLQSEKVTLTPEEIILINDELVFENLEYKNIDPVEFTVPSDESVDEEEGFTPLDYRFTVNSEASNEELVALGPKIIKSERVEADNEAIAASFIWYLISK